MLLLLAAGKSERYGVSDKLAEDFLGKPLAFHVVTAMENLPFKARIVVVDGARLDFASRGYRVVTNERPQDGVSGSVRLAVATAREANPTSVIIALADMPRVTAAQIHRLFDASKGAESVVASSDGVSPKPPALFGSAHFDTLENLTGDEGARPLIRAGRHVVTTPAELIDIDTIEELDELRKLF
ncbi:MAG: nucleotidyltransferase family protein [Sphingomonas sp.]